MANEKILVVDDELPIRLALKTAFLREGMQVQEASCGKEALEALKGDHYDLVVLDVMMEDMDGYTILQKLRAAEDMTPVLMLSGKQEEMDQILGLGMGADDYLTKPFHLSVLIQKVKALIRRNSIYSQNHKNQIMEGVFRFDLMSLRHLRERKNCSLRQGSCPYSAFLWNIREEYLPKSSYIIRSGMRIWWMIIL